MKRVLVSAFSVVFIVAMLLTFASCGGSKVYSDFPEFKTVQDILDKDPSLLKTSYSNDSITICFIFGDKAVKARAKLDKTTYDALDAIDSLDDDAETKRNELIAPMEVTSTQDISEGLVTQATLDSYVGKTCDQLVKDGFSMSGYWSSDETFITFDKGDFSYDFKVEGYDGEDITEEKLNTYTIVSAVVSDFSFSLLLWD